MKRFYKKNISWFLILGIILMNLSSLFLFPPKKAQAAWWNSSWAYKKQINLTAGSGAGTDYQMKLLAGESTGSSGYSFHLEGHGKSDFGDLRFTNSAEDTELSYWIESILGTTPNQTATVWVKVTDSLDSNATIYVYYGNASATYNNSTGGSNTFIFFDDFSGDLSKWIKHKELGIISLTGGYVECGGGTTSSPYGHTVLGSSATYTGFQDGIIEFKHYHAANGIGEVSYRGNYASNTGYKGRWDARSGSESVFLKPPYSGWANIDDAMTKWIIAGIWYKGKSVMHGNIMDLYDNDSFKNTLTDTSYTSAGEISLQDHYGSYTRFDDVRVRKYASTEPAFSSAGSEEFRLTVGTTGTQTSTMDIPSTDNCVGGAFTFVCNTGSANVTQIIISETDATLSADSYLSNVKLYYKQEASCSASIPGDATAFNATGVGFTSEKATVIGDSPIAVGTSQTCVYVQLNVESGAPDGDSFDIEISNPSTEVTVSAGTVSPGTAVAIDGATTLQEAAPGGSLTLSNLTNIQWGDAAAGTTKNGIINCTISTTGATYDVKVAKDQDLTSGGNTIPSTSFTYTSSYNSGTPNTGVTYQTSSTQFATTSGTNVVSVSSGTAADNLNINVNYTLVIPPTQTAASSYTATHTYTLTVQ